MKRKDFIKAVSIFTITMPFLNSCASDEEESIAPMATYKVVKDLCTSCLKCVAICPELEREVIVQEGDTVVIHQNLCTECGECYVICPYDAIIEDTRTIEESEMLHVLQDKCDGCELCEPACPTEAIIVTAGKAFITEDDCVHCNKCVEVCEPDAIITGKLT